MIRRATGADTAGIVELLLAAQPSTPYATLPVSRGKVTRQIALVISRGYSWVRVKGSTVQAVCLADCTETLFGLHVFAVHSVFGEGGFWLLKKVLADAKAFGADEVAIGSSLTSDDNMINEMVQRLGGVRTGSTYGVYLTWKQ